MVRCAYCPARGIIRRPKTGCAACKECFFRVFEDEIHETIVNGNLFRAGDRVALAASGGKDSTVLAYVIKTLNDRYNYGLDLVLLSIDEGITGYRDDSLATVEINSHEYGLPLTILTYEQLYNGWTMDRVVQKIGRKGNCTYCGVFRRQALDRGASKLQVSQILTGHNADDMAETVLMNILRGDIARLRRCTELITGDQLTFAPSSSEKNNSNLAEYESTDNSILVSPCASHTVLNKDLNFDKKEDTQFNAEVPDDVRETAENRINIIRSKPLKWAYEKEIVMYAYFRRLTYFSTECTYAPNAYRGHARAFLKNLEAIRPSAIIDIIRSGEAFRHLPTGGIDPKAPNPQKEIKALRTCESCGYISSNILCKACMLLESLGSASSRNLS